MLRYSGPLPANDKNPVRDKHEVRMAISPQLEMFCKRDGFFNDCLLPDLLTGQIDRKGKLQFNHEENHPHNNKLFCRVPIGDWEFVPLIHRQAYLACELDITWLRAERAGDLLHGGDLDNRLKTLFDGLRTPYNKNELPANASPGRVYCLLDDDALITKLSVSTHQMLEEKNSGPRKTHVELFIHVKVIVTKAVMANLGI